MPISALHLKDHAHESEDEHDEPSRWAKTFKMALILAVIGGIVYFFVWADKDILADKFSMVSVIFNRFDEWIGRMAGVFAGNTRE